MRAELKQFIRFGKKLKGKPVSVQKHQCNSRVKDGKYRHNKKNIKCVGSRRVQTELAFHWLFSFFLFASV